MRIFFLLVLLICILGYVRAEQPATWNSWMAALGASSAVVATNSDDTTAGPASSSPAPTPPPPRTIPVGGAIQNGNFVSGEGAWQGDGQPDASGKGLVVHLNPSSWTRVYQTFSSGAGTLYSIEVTYKLSPGLTVSRDPSDYTDISKRLKIDGFENYGSIAIPPGNFYGTIGGPPASNICCELFDPQLGSTGVHDYQHDYPAIPPNGTKTFALAFPPGTGSVTLLTAYVMSR